MVQFSLNNVQKGGLKQDHVIVIFYGLFGVFFTMFSLDKNLNRPIMVFITARLSVCFLFCFTECFTTTFLHTHSWLNWL